MTRALILGALGQDGSYLTEHLIADGYEVFGGTHRGRGGAFSLSGAALVHADLLDPRSLREALHDVGPDEIYNLAAVTAAGLGWADAPPAALVETNVIGVLNLLDAVCAVAQTARLVHASSSAIYEPARYGLYGSSKLMAHDAVRGYRDERGLRASNAVLYSHTSVRQPRAFLARQVAAGAAAIARGEIEFLELSNLDARRDWGWASDYARAIALMGRSELLDDRVVRTGRVHSVRDLAEAALAAAGLVDGVERWVRCPPPEFVRPRPEALPTLGLRGPGRWAPTVTFEEMIGDLVRAEEPAWASE